MITAEVLGLGADEVRPMVTDTDSIGHTDVTGGSRITLATGMAVFQAAQDALHQLKERAARLWEKKLEEIEFNNGIFSAKGEGIFVDAIVSNPGGCQLLGSSEPNHFRHWNCWFVTSSPLLGRSRRLTTNRFGPANIESGQEDARQYETPERQLVDVIPSITEFARSLFPSPRCRTRTID